MQVLGGGKLKISVVFKQIQRNPMSKNKAIKSREPWRAIKAEKGVSVLAKTDVENAFGL